MFTQFRKGTPHKIYSDKSFNDSINKSETKTPKEKSIPQKEKNQSLKEWKELLQEEEDKLSLLIKWSNETINSSPFNNTPYFIKNSLESKQKRHKFLLKELLKIPKINNENIYKEFLENITKIDSAISLWTRLEILEKKDSKKIESIKKYIFNNQGNEDIFINISNIDLLFAKCLGNSFTKEIVVEISLVQYILAPYIKKFKYAELIQDSSIIPWFINDNLVSFVSNIISQTIESIKRESTYFIDKTFELIRIVLRVLNSFYAELSFDSVIKKNIEEFNNRLLRLIGSPHYLAKGIKKTEKRDLLELMKALSQKYSKDPEKMREFETKFLNLSKEYENFDAVFEWADFTLQGADLNQSKIFSNFVVEYPQKIPELFRWLLSKGKEFADSNRIDDKSYYFKALSFAQHHRYDISDILSQDSYEHLKWIHFLGTGNDNKYPLISDNLTSLKVRAEDNEEKKTTLHNFNMFAKACFMSTEELLIEEKNELDLSFSDEN